MTRLASKYESSPENQVVFDLSAILDYPIQLVVNSWHSDNPLSWFSKSDDGILAEGRFLEAPGLPLFTLGDDTGRRLSDDIPEDVLAVARLIPAMDFELTRACAASEAALELAQSAPLLFILLVNYARSSRLLLKSLSSF